MRRRGGRAKKRQEKGNQSPYGSAGVRERGSEQGWRGAHWRRRPCLPPSHALTRAFTPVLQDRLPTPLRTRTTSPTHSAARRKFPRGAADRMTVHGYPPPTTEQLLIRTAPLRRFAVRGGQGRNSSGGGATRSKIPHNQSIRSSGYPVHPLTSSMNKYRCT